MKANDHIPVWAWRGGIILLGEATLVTLGLLAATLAGIADPHPLGVLTVADAFADTNRWHLASDDGRVGAPEMADGHYEISVGTGDGQLIGVSPDELECPCTIELRAMQVSGSKDAGYGLWWGDTDHQPAILVGVNSDGYLGILPGHSDSGEPVRDWELFPHVRPLGQSNVFRADIDGGQATVLLNDELVSQFGLNTQGWISAGFFVRQSSHGGAVFHFLSFKAWETEPAYSIIKTEAKGNWPP